MKWLVYLGFTLLLTQLTHAQSTEQSDPLRPAPSVPDTLNTPTAQTDSTAVGSADEGEDEAEEGDSSNTVRMRLTTDGTFTRGNVNRALLQLTGAFDYALSKGVKLSSNPSFLYGRLNNLLNEREFFGDIRTTFRHQKRLYYLTFGSFERSNLRQILTRYTAAVGAGYKLIDQKQHYLSFTYVLLHENTDFAELNDINVFRNSLRLFGQYTFGEDRWTLSHTTFYQPAFGRPNLRWSASISLAVKINTALSLRTTLFNAYESLVVPGRQNDDLRWTMGIVFDQK